MGGGEGIKNYELKNYARGVAVSWVKGKSLWENGCFSGIFFAAKERKQKALKGFFGGISKEIMLLREQEKLEKARAWCHSAIVFSSSSAKETFRSLTL